MSGGTEILKLNCPDAVGLVARLTGFLAGCGANLTEVHQYTDPLSGWFFTRMQIEPGPGGAEKLRSGLGPIAEELRAKWSLRGAGEALRMVVLASREEHCVAELLWRKRGGELRVEIPAVIANHEDCRGLVEAEGLAFERIEIPAAERDAAFRRIDERCVALGAELIVMARFMQILPDWFCEKWAGRVLNIHHSFLPAFAGANPYRQAFERGVKLIGATCHYATAELDAGPIVEQEVMRVEHFHEIGDLKRIGRDCERLALARGVRFYVEDRVLVHGARAIVFRD